jgi:NSS family neurotransmitter:Na+ symporter
MAKRESWGSQLGFIFAVAGSAIGLANIWRFPYIVGKYGGAAFILLYLLFLLLIGFPVFISEMLIGKKTQTSPSGAFAKISDSPDWSFAGKLTIATGFIVSSFYSAVAGWILGYLIEAIRGNVSNFTECVQAEAHYQCLMLNPLWGLSFHFLFLVMCFGVLKSGVQGGIERANKWLMPLLYVVLFLLVLKGISMPNASRGLAFLFTPNWSVLTPTAVMAALGQAFFTLSLGQGTMVTYGSYLNKKDNLLKNCFPVALLDTVVSLLSAIAVFTIVFASEMEPASGPGLLFNTLPWAFSQLPGGHLIAVMFFLLVVMAALTSEISAMEPTIAYLIDEWNWKRTSAALFTFGGVFLLGIPSALSFNLLKEYTWMGWNFLEVVEFLCSSILIPLGGLLAVVMVGWVWGVPKALEELKKGALPLFKKHSWLNSYFWFCLKYSAPVLIIVIFLNALGVFL